MLLVEQQKHKSEKSRTEPSVCRIEIDSQLND